MFYVYVLSFLFFPCLYLVMRVYLEITRSYNLTYMFYRQSTYNDRGLNGEAIQLLCRSRGGHGPRAELRGGPQKSLEFKTSGSRLLICRRLWFSRCFKSRVADVHDFSIQDFSRQGISCALRLSFFTAFPFQVTSCRCSWFFNTWFYKTGILWFCPNFDTRRFTAPHGQIVGGRCELAFVTYVCGISLKGLFLWRLQLMPCMFVYAVHGEDQADKTNF